MPPLAATSAPRHDSHIGKELSRRPIVWCAPCIAAQRAHATRAQQSTNSAKRADNPDKSEACAQETGHPATSRAPFMPASTRPLQAALPHLNRTRCTAQEQARAHSPLPGRESCAPQGSLHTAREAGADHVRHQNTSRLLVGQVAPCWSKVL